ncbi:MAG: hypothetical protein ACIWVG_14670, partial [Gloeotrichia echinulata HAB0833]
MVVRSVVFYQIFAFAQRFPRTNATYVAMTEHIIQNSRFQHGRGLYSRRHNDRSVHRWGHFGKLSASLGY